MNQAKRSTGLFHNIIHRDQFDIKGCTRIARVADGKRTREIEPKPKKRVRRRGVCFVKTWLDIRGADGNTSGAKIIETK